MIITKMNETLEEVLSSRNVSISKLCRLCLSDQGTMLELFDTHDSTQDPLLLDKVFESTSVKITRDDVLPTKLCLECCSEVERMHTFRTKCLASNSLLREHKRRLLRQKMTL